MFMQNRNRRASCSLRSGFVCATAAGAARLLATTSATKKRLLLMAHNLPRRPGTCCPGHWSRTVRRRDFKGDAVSFGERWREIRSGFERSFWIANFTELFERLAYYGL